MSYNSLWINLQLSVATKFLWFIASRSLSADKTTIYNKVQRAGSIKFYTLSIAVNVQLTEFAEFGNTIQTLNDIYSIFITTKNYTTIVV